MRGTHCVALGLAAVVLSCAHSRTEVQPQAMWMSTSGADEAQFYRDTSDCLSQTQSAGDQFPLCMKRMGWEQQVPVAAPPQPAAPKGR